LIPLGSAAFLLFGVLLVVLGACHSGLSDSLELDHTAFGLLGSALSAGIATGVLIAGPLVDRYPRRPLFLGSTLIVAAAMGSVEPHMSFARALMVPVGAMVTPWLVSQTGGAAEWIDFFRLIGVAFLALSVWVACVSLPAPAHQPAEHVRSPVAAFVRPAFLALCVVALAYIGIEAALTLFAVPYATDGLGLGEAHGQRAISAVWLGILIGRFLLMLPSRAVDARVLIGSGLLGAVLIAAGVSLAVTPIELVMGACGLALSGVFPLMIALAGQLVPEAPGKAVALVAGLGSIGGFVLPPLTGAIADELGISTAMASLALWCALIAVAGAVAQREARR
jgi:fucose permease